MVVRPWLQLPTIHSLPCIDRFFFVVRAASQNILVPEFLSWLSLALSFHMLGYAVTPAIRIFLILNGQFPLTHSVFLLSYRPNFLSGFSSSVLPRRFMFLNMASHPLMYCT